MKRRRSRQRQPGLRARLARLDAFLREYTAGFSASELKRLFQRDAAHAYAVLTREHARDKEPKRGLRRLLFRSRLAFLGLSYKLTPARRMLFVLSLLFFLCGLMQSPQVLLRSGVLHLTIDFSPFWFIASVGALTYLLALELVDRIRVRDELEVARELQAELLPQRIPPVAGYTFAHSYRTANEVGGDYYDVTLLPDGRVALLVADASGHGMAAGLVMAIANATLKTALDLDPAPEKALALLNRTLCRTGTRRTFMSIFYAVLTPATGGLEYVCAGHPFPFLRRQDGAVEELGSGALPLGLRTDVAFSCRAEEMRPGDLLVLYTDGLAEAVDARGQAFGYDGIRKVLDLEGSPDLVHDRVLAAFDRHVGDEVLLDDLTLLVISRPTAATTGPAPASG